MQERQLNLGKHSKQALCSFKLPYSHDPLASSMGAFKTNRLTTMATLETSRLAVTGEGRTGSQCLRNPVSRGATLYDLCGSS